MIPGVGQEADFPVGLGLAVLGGCSAGVRDLLGGAVAVQAQEAELHRAGPRVFQLQGHKTAGAASGGSAPHEDKPCQGPAGPAGPSRLLKHWSSVQKAVSHPSVHSQGSWVLSHHGRVEPGDP